MLMFASAYECINSLLQPIASFLEVVSLYYIIIRNDFQKSFAKKMFPSAKYPY